MKLIILALAFASTARADSYFVESARGDDDVSSKVTSLIVNQVKSAPGQTLAGNTQGVDFTLAAKVTKIGGAYAISIDKIHDGHLVQSGKAKAAKEEDLDRAVAKAMDTLIKHGAKRAGPPIQNLKMPAPKAPETNQAAPAVPPESQLAPGKPGQTAPAAPLND